MARAVVVVESLFGNTEKVGRAVAEGLAERMPVEVVSVSDAPVAVDGDTTLLVAGGPTHAFGMTRASTRRAAVDQGGSSPQGTDIGLREWLAVLHPVTGGVGAVAFDTRVQKRGIPGSAARGAQKRLVQLGFRAAAPWKTFYVTGTPGPLADGEVQRARAWGGELARAHLALSPHGTVDS